MKLALDTYGPNTQKDDHGVGTDGDIKEDYRSLGFDVSRNYYSQNYHHWKYFENYCGFSVAFKDSENGGKIVVISVRGTVGGIGDIKKLKAPSPEWVSNLIGTVPTIKNIGWHQGFYKPACEIMSTLERVGLVNTVNTKFFISGHSRGAGVANVLAVLLLNKGVRKENVFDYNFACPDTMHAPAVTDWTGSGNYNSIFNINAANDLVGVVPGALCDHIDFWLPKAGASSINLWGKYGKTYFYSFDWNSMKRSMVEVFSFALDQGANNPHQPDMYLDYLSKMNSADSFKSYAQVKLQNAADVMMVLWAFCPVDMTLVDNSGNNIAAVIDGKVVYYNNYGMDDVLVLTDGDVKAFFVNPSINCSVKLTGTGTGNLTFVSGMTNLYGQELKSEKAFTNIKLAGNKKFISEGLVSQSTNQLKLFTVNGNGKKEAEVNTNGTETKIVNTQPQLKDTQPSQQEKKEEIITSPVLNELITINYTPQKLKAKAKKKKITVSWKKIKKTKKTKTLLKQIHGIEVQYSTDPGFPVESSVKVPLGKKKTKLVLKGLQPKTQYFVRVRYTDGAGGYSNWSAVKAFKTK